MKLKKVLGRRTYDFLLKVYVTTLLEQTAKAIARRKQGFDASAAVDFLFSRKGSIIRPMQIRDELLKLAETIERLKPATVLEIGTARGGTLFLAAQLAAENAHIISIDLPGGMYGGGYPDWKIPYYTRLKRPRQKLTLIQGDSHSKTVHDKLAEALGGAQIDYLFVDGDHTYEGVKQDFETYSRFVRPGGIVAFHDIVVDRSPIPDHFVHRFWKEVSKEYPSREIIFDAHQSKLGIGILEMNKAS